MLIGFPANVTSCTLPSTLSLHDALPISGLIDQVTPVGIGSVRLTPFAVPGPLLLTVTVNPIASTALTDTASAQFGMWMFCCLHVITASAESDPSLVVDTDAVLSYVAHACAEV